MTETSTKHDMNHYKSPQTMTWTIMMTQKELCIKPYGFLVYPCIGFVCQLVWLVYMVCWNKLKMLLDRSPNFTLCFFPSDCYDLMLQIFILLLKYMCFTLFSTFNLILLTTGTTGRDGHETYGFCQLIWLVAPLLVILSWNVVISYPIGVGLEVLVNRYGWS